MGAIIPNIVITPNTSTYVMSFVIASNGDVIAFVQRTGNDTDCGSSEDVVYLRKLIGTHISCMQEYEKIPVPRIGHCSL